MSSCPPECWVGGGGGGGGGDEVDSTGSDAVGDDVAGLEISPFSSLEATWGEEHRTASLLVSLGTELSLTKSKHWSISRSILFSVSQEGF